MKKIMVTVCAIAFAFAANAAAVSWSLEKDTAKTYGNRTAYVINGADYAAVTALLTAGGANIASDFNAYVIDSVGLNSRGAGASNSTGVTGTSLAWFIFDDDQIQDGSAYSTTGIMDVTDYVFTPPASSPGDFIFQATSFTTTGAAIGGAAPAVPEPTSGLLMLVGLGALALRRRRA